MKSLADTLDIVMKKSREMDMLQDEINDLAMQARKTYQNMDENDHLMEEEECFLTCIDSYATI